MKKVLFIAVLFIASLGKINGQSFGATAGYHNFIASAEATAQGQTGTDSEGVSGFFFGLFADFTVNEKFHIQPEIHFAQVSQNGGEGNSLIIPVMAKYYLVDKFSVHAGPLVDIILDESQGINAVGVGLAAGASYDFTDKFFLTSRYSFGLGNRLEQNTIFVPQVGNVDISTSFNYFQVGIGYRF